MIDSNLFEGMNEVAKTVQTEYLSLGVYPMKLVSVTQEKSKQNKDLLLVMLDTGFKNSDGSVRFFRQYFNVDGTFKDKGKETPMIQMFVKFMKQGFGLETFDQISINKCIGMTASVATKRDENGYIAFYYIGLIKNLHMMQSTYKPQDLSNGKRPETKGTVSTEAPQFDKAPDYVLDSQNGNGGNINLEPHHNYGIDDLPF